MKLFMIPELWTAVQKQTADHLGEELCTRKSSFNRYITGGGILASSGFVEQLSVPHIPGSAPQQLMQANTDRIEKEKRMREAELMLKEIVAWLIIQQYEASGATDKVLIG